ncbi:hypothetical protein L6Q96_21885 [Candidatus Binatia bacterium]|nr:hypothetical protein [Candidatus Binatia bacterium]
MKLQNLVTRVAVGLMCGVTAAVGQEHTAVHGIAMHGTLKYPPDFAHFEYVNPQAPKGG